MSLHLIFAAAAFLMLAGCATQIPANHFAGSTDAQLFRQLGVHPDWDETYPATAVQPPFQAAVQRLFPAEKFESRNTMIREITWEHNGHDLVVIFYQRQGQWVAIDAAEKGRAVVW